MQEYEQVTAGSRGVRGTWDMRHEPCRIAFTSSGAVLRERVGRRCGSCLLESIPHVDVSASFLLPLLPPERAAKMPRALGGEKQSLGPALITMMPGVPTAGP